MTDKKTNTELVRERFLKMVSNAIDPEWHGSYPTMSEVIVDEILADPDILVKDKDQSLPWNPDNYKSMKVEKGEHCNIHCHNEERDRTQDIMRHSYWVKVEPKEIKK